MKKLFIFILVLSGSQLFAQFHTTYDWVENPEIHALTLDELNTSSLAIQKKLIVEYRPDAEANNISVLETTHNIIRVNDAAGVSRHTQIYIPMYRVSNIESIKARTINKDGKITNLDESSIKELENVEEYGDFKIFAIEGAEINSEIEVLYTLKKEFTPFGTETLQTDYPIQRSEVVFITNNLSGTIKTYNTDQNFERTYLENMLVEELVIDDLLPIEEEEYSATNANKIYVAYQCFGNPNLTQDILWSNTVGNIGSTLFSSDISSIVKDEVTNQILKNRADDITDYEKAALLENYIKSNFMVIDNNNELLEDINYILKNRSASSFGIIKTYGQFLKVMDLEYEVVVTADRYQHRFDTEYYNPNALRDFLIYLPTLKQYITPERLDYRLSEAPINYLGNGALFITESLDFYFDKITQVDPKFSEVKRIMDVSFSEDFDKVIVDEDQEYTGHWGVLYRALMTYYSGQDKADVEDQLTGSGIDDKQTTKFEIENPDMNQTEYNVPYIVKSTIESGGLLEEAGESYIFELGKIIGIQSELYQEKERVNPIEMQYPNEYFYTITVDIPEGYTIEGTESLILNKQLEVDGTILCKFESGYEIQGNKLVISINEFYRVNEFPKEHYEGFRAVINAASDFNKATILYNPE